ncbi:hypothetical protein IAU60_000097 [Kwoniella sp. DSM 27419]
MPLYKLTEKRMKKKAREDEDGITQLKAAMREMGDDVDSGSEGWSESSDDEDDEDDEEDEGDEGDGESDDDDEEEDDAEIDVDVEGMDDSDDEDDEEESEAGSVASSSGSVFPITLEGATSNPIYDSGSDRLCVLCPDKSMKNEHMVKAHLDSKGHKRAAKRYASRLASGDVPPDADPREVVDDILAGLDELQAEVSASASSAPGSKAVPADGAAGSKRKREGKGSKKERREAKARALLESAGGAVDRPTKEQEANGADGAGLNRKARRLLALQKGEISAKSPTKGARSLDAGADVKSSSKATLAAASSSGGKKKRKSKV